MQPAAVDESGGIPRAEASERIRALEAAKRSIEGFDGCAELIDDLDGKIRVLKDGTVSQKPLQEQLTAALAFAERKRLRLEEVDKSIAELRSERVSLGDIIAKTARRIVELQIQVAEQLRAKAEQQRARVLEPIPAAASEDVYMDDIDAARARLVVESLRALPGMPQAAMELIGTCSSPGATPQPRSPNPTTPAAQVPAAAPAEAVLVVDLVAEGDLANLDGAYGPARPARRALPEPYQASAPAEVGEATPRL